MLIPDGVFEKLSYLGKFRECLEKWYCTVGAVRHYSRNGLDSPLNASCKWTHTR